MNHSKSIPGVVLLITSLLVVAQTFAAYQRDAKLNLQSTAPECDVGNATTHFELSWSNSAGATSYQINTGHQCRLGASVCGISNPSCVVACAEPQCSVELAGCPYRRGAPWAQVKALDGATVYYRITVGWPAEICE